MDSHWQFEQCHLITMLCLIVPIKRTNRDTPPYDIRKFTFVIILQETLRELNIWICTVGEDIRPYAIDIEFCSKSSHVVNIDPLGFSSPHIVNNDFKKRASIGNPNWNQVPIVFFIFASQLDRVAASEWGLGVWSTW